MFTPADGPEPGRLEDLTEAPSFSLSPADLTPSLLGLVLALRAAGRDVQILDHAPPTTTSPAPGLRFWGYVGMLNAPDLETIVDAATRSAVGTYHLDLGGLQTFSLLAWPALQRATRSFRARGGRLRVTVPAGARRLSQGYLDDLRFRDLELA
jgi:hypothetical protein